MHKFTTAIGLSAIALAFLAADGVHVRAERMRKPLATITMVVATVDMTEQVEAIKSANADGVLAADYSWQRWPSVTDF
jgi:hypothetical protein